MGKVWVPGPLRPTPDKYVTVREWMDNPNNDSVLKGWPGKVSDTLTTLGGYNYTGFFDRAVIYDSEFEFLACAAQQQAMALPANRFGSVETQSSACAETHFICSTVP